MRNEIDNSIYHSILLWYYSFLWTSSDHCNVSSDGSSTFVFLRSHITIFMLAVSLSCINAVQDCCLHGHILSWGSRALSLDLVFRKYSILLKYLKQENETFMFFKSIIFCSIPIISYLPTICIENQLALINIFKIIEE